MNKTLFAISVIAVSSFGFAAQAATCSEMFNKSERMLTAKSYVAVEKKIKGYEMAIDSYVMCEKAMAMTAGSDKDAMMKDAESAFGKVFTFARDVEWVACLTPGADPSRAGSSQVPFPAGSPQARVAYAFSNLE